MNIRKKRSDNRFITRQQFIRLNRYKKYCTTYKEVIPLSHKIVGYSLMGFSLIFPDLGIGFILGIALVTEPTIKRAIKELPVLVRISLRKVTKRLTKVYGMVRK